MITRTSRPSLPRPAERSGSPEFLRVLRGPLREGAPRPYGDPPRRVGRGHADRALPGPRHELDGLVVEAPGAPARDGLLVAELAEGDLASDRLGEGVHLLRHVQRLGAGDHISLAAVSGLGAWGLCDVRDVGLVDDRAAAVRSRLGDLPLVADRLRPPPRIGP